MKLNSLYDRFAFIWNGIILVTPLILTWSLMQIPQKDDPSLGKSWDFLCWESSWHDFTVIFNFSKALHENPIERPYTTEGQLEGYRCWLQTERDSVMPVSYFPTCYVLWGWLSWLSPPSAFFLGNALVSLIWLMATQRLQKLLGPLQGTLLSISIVASAIGYLSFYFGQTGLLFAGLLILISHPIIFNPFALTLSSSFAILLLTAKPPGAVLAWTTLLCQKRFREFFISLIAPTLLTFLFCLQHGGIQTLIDYFHWIQSCSMISIAAPFAKAICPIFQSNFISFAMGINLLDPLSILSLNQCFILISLILGGTLFFFKIVPLRLAPSFAGWLYLLFSPYLGITEDLIAGWIVAQWMLRHRNHWKLGIGWLLFLLNTGQFFGILAPSFFYNYPVSWPTKLLGFGLWLYFEISKTPSIFRKINS